MWKRSVREVWEVGVATVEAEEVPGVREGGRSPLRIRVGRRSPAPLRDGGCRRAWTTCPDSVRREVSVAELKKDAAPAIDFDDADAHLVGREDGEGAVVLVAGEEFSPRMRAGWGVQPEVGDFGGRPVGEGEAFVAGICSCGMLSSAKKTWRVRGPWFVFAPFNGAVEAQTFEVDIGFFGELA